MNPSLAEQEFTDKLTDHLTTFYRDTVGLSQIDERISYRAREEVVEEARLTALLKRLELSPNANLKMLVVGSGWGGMCVAASRLGIDIHGIDIDEESVGISRLRFLKEGIQHTPVQLAAAEHLPFQNDSFDLVYCFSVVEHVNDVKATVSEISRVVKPGGYVYVQTQNFSIPWEPHYKLVIPTFLGHRICRLILRMRRRNPDYVDTVNFIRGGSFSKLVRDTGLQIVEKWDIVKSTASQRQGSAGQAPKRQTGGPLKYFKQPDLYIGEVMIRLLSVVGIRNIHWICKKGEAQVSPKSD